MRVEGLVIAACLSSAAAAAPLDDSAASEEEGFPPRAEFILAQSAHGFTQGVVGCALATCPSDVLRIAIPLGTGAIGGGMAYVLSTQGITGSTALLIDSGTFAGAWLGWSLGAALQLPWDEQLGFLAAGLPLGTAAGALLSLVWNPSVGQLSLMNSCGIWLGAISGLVLTGGHLPPSTIYAVMLPASAVGLGLGVLLARHYPRFSRLHALVLDLGGLMGGLGGAAAGVFISPSDWRYVGAAAGVGAAVGLTLAWLTTRRAPDMTISLSPMVGGRPGVAVAGIF